MRIQLGVCAVVALVGVAVAQPRSQTSAGREGPPYEAAVRLAAFAQAAPVETPDATYGTSVQGFDRPLAGARSPRNANYEIDVRLDHEQRTLSGRQTIRWRNISWSQATELQFHLYWNAWRNRESTWLRERRLLPAYTPPQDDPWGSIEVTSLRVRRRDGATVDLTPAMRFAAPDDENASDWTVMRTPLPFSVATGETIDIDIEWRARVPRPFARTGYIGDYYFIAHWFPKLGVLEDRGWNTHQFHSATEFYADYGVYDVAITLPQRFIVGASGRQTGRTDHGDGTATHRFRGEDIHDFAWTASPDFIEFRRTVDLTPAQGGPEGPPLRETAPGGPEGPPLRARTIEMRLLLQPEHAGQEDRHFAATAATLRLFGDWFGPYPYDHITIVDPAYQSRSGGMEYPTLLTAGTRWLAPRDVASPESVTVHETGHQFWHGIVGTNEVEHAWMDEGLTTFGTARVLDEIDVPNRVALRFFGGFIPWVVGDIRLSRATDGNRLNTYRLNARAEVPATPTFRYWPATATPITYDKVALWLHTLERHLGWPTLRAILSTYFERWRFRHPEPAHFFAVANEVADQDLTWFFDQVYRGSHVFDYAVQDLASERADDGSYRTTVAATRRGDGVFPIDVVTTFEDGEQVQERWDGASQRIVYVYETSSRAKRAQVDPQRVLLLDVNYANNSVTLEPRADEASLKWALKWMVWVQDLMLTYGFFL